MSYYMQIFAASKQIFTIKFNIGNHPNILSQCVNCSRHEACYFHGCGLEKESFCVALKDWKIRGDS